VESITVNQLLKHTSGWTTHWGDHLFIPHTVAEFLNVSSPVSSDQIIEFVLAKKLHYSPGTRYAYTNISYLILGEVIEKVTGNNYEDYVNASVLFPLGIYNMNIGKTLLSEKLENEVNYYEQSNADSVKSIYDKSTLISRRYGGTDISTLGAAGGWIGTPSELLKLVAAIDGDKYRFDILSQETIDLMVNKDRRSYPVGWRGSNGKTTWWRTGSLAGTSALIVHQNDEISYAIITNTSSWKGSDFTLGLNRLMQSVIKSCSSMPNRDLFIPADTTINILSLR
jgi:CubicO group peptidase (beta-lactamase class C family)